MHTSTACPSTGVAAFSSELCTSWGPPHHGHALWAMDFTREFSKYPPLKDAKSPPVASKPSTSSPFTSLISFCFECQDIDHAMALHAAYTRVPYKLATTNSIHSVSDSQISGNEPLSSTLTSTWRIGWRTPALIIGSYLLGMSPSINLLCCYLLTEYSHHCGIWQLWLFQVSQWEICRRT